MFSMSWFRRTSMWTSVWSLLTGSGIIIRWSPWAWSPPDKVPEELAEYRLERAELAIALPPDWRMDEESMKDSGGTGRSVC